MKVGKSGLENCTSATTPGQRIDDKIRQNAHHNGMAVLGLGLLGHRSIAKTPLDTFTAELGQVNMCVHDNQAFDVRVSVSAFTQVLAVIPPAWCVMVGRDFAVFAFNSAQESSSPAEWASMRGSMALQE